MNFYSPYTIRYGTTTENGHTYGYYTYESSYKPKYEWKETIFKIPHKILALRKLKRNITYII